MSLSDKERRSLEEEFRRVRRPGAAHLALPELLAFSAPAPALPAPRLDALGLLWVADRDRDGRVSLPDLVALAEWCRARGRRAPRGAAPHEAAAAARGAAALELGRALCAPGGADRFAAWVGELAAAASPGRRRFWRTGGGETYVDAAAVGALHAALRAGPLAGVGLQAFLDLLQRAAEERGLLDLADPGQDEWVPLAVVRDAARALGGGVASLMADVVPRCCAAPALPGSGRSSSTGGRPGAGAASWRSGPTARVRG